MNAFLDATPPINTTPDTNSGLAPLFIIIFFTLLALVIVFLCLYISAKQNNKKNPTQQANISEEEQSVLDKYRNLKDSDKTVINQMLNSLDNNNLHKE